MKPEDVLAKHPSLLNIGDLFRLAHLHKFGKDLPPSIRAREIASFHTCGHEPAYVTEYLLRFKIEEDK